MKAALAHLARIAILATLPACSSPRDSLQPDGAALSPPGAGGATGRVDMGAAVADGPGPTPAPSQEAGVPALDAGPTPPDAPPAAPGRANLTVTFTGGGKGIVRPAPGVATCQATCVLDYPVGQTVILTAEPTPPATFAGFTGACTGTAACMVTLDRSLAVTARFDESAGPVWKVPLTHGNVLGLAERGGKVYAAGSAQDEFDGSVVAPDRRDIYVARFDLATGNRDWIRRVRGLVPRTNTGGQTVGIDALGAIVLTGEMIHAADFGGALLQPPPELRFMARYAADTGALLGVRLGRGGDWTADSNNTLIVGDQSRYWQVRSLDDVTTGPPADVTPDDMRAGALSAAGDLVVAGSFTSTLRFGATLLSGPARRSAWVGKTGINARPLWAVALTGGGDSYAEAVAIDAGGDVIVTGYFSGTATIGGRSLTSAGEADAFVVKLSGSDGSVRWARTFGGSKYDGGSGAGSSPDGTVYVSIATGGSVTVEGTTTYDGPGFVAALAPSDGATRWTRPLDDTPRSFLLASNGHLLVGGWSSLVKLVP